MSPISPRSMAGFTWSGVDPTRPRRPPIGDGWCVRDAFCALMHWPIDGPDWSHFIEGPNPEDMERLESHLGLQGFDPEYEPHKRQLAVLSDHPGIACWELHAFRFGHVMYQPNVRHLRALPAQYKSFQPELIRIIVDPNQPPHD